MRESPTSRALSEVTIGNGCCRALVPKRKLDLAPPTNQRDRPAICVYSRLWSLDGASELCFIAEAMLVPTIATPQQPIGSLSRLSPVSIALAESQ